MLPAAPPKYDSWAELVSPIEEGETGWRPYALQVALTSLGRSLIADGVFGPATKSKVENFQAGNGLSPDGVAGVATQRAIVAKLGSKTHERLARVPDGLMRGFAEGEGANVLAATNWSVAGGVDCGCMQYRVFGPPYDFGALQGAFDPLASMVSAGKDFLARADVFARGAYVQSLLAAHREELSKRVAIMAHNWPAGAAAIAKTGVCSSPGSPATWVAPGTKFPDGAPVRTRWEWCQFYALGGAHGEASIARYVTDWS